MYSNIWNYNKQEYKIPEYHSKYEVKAVLPMIWLEHCVECSMPLCYKTCQLFEARLDGRCSRFANGIQPLILRGQKLKGATIQFKRWAKLEAILPYGLYGVDYDKVVRIEEVFNKTSALLENLSSLIFRHWHWHRPSRVFESLFERFLIFHKFSMQNPLSGFLAVIYNHEAVEKKVHMEIIQKEKTIFHKSLTLCLGWNEFYIPISDIALHANTQSLVRLYFDNQDYGTLSFKYLDFVSLKTEINQELRTSPASKIKCVAWDLDNTLWDGIIGDIGPQGVHIKSDSILMIKRFDEMGIIQTIVSKNNFDLAWEKIKEIGIDEYFLYPAINWGRKSQSLLSIAKELNINIDTFAVIDDSSFERMEISKTLPQVRVFDIKELDSLLNRPEFNIPITTESSKRRSSYIIDSKRKNILASWSEDYDAFLKSCDLKMSVFKPFTMEDIDRCLELLQRSNQYNVSRLKRDSEYLKIILNDNPYKSFCYTVKDRYGDYGIVGFASFEIKENDIYIRDFVMSCRVAQKKVERAFLNYVINRFPLRSSIYIIIEKTDRNMPLCNELKKMPFNILEENIKKLSLMYQKGDADFLDEHIIDVY